MSSFFFCSVLFGRGEPTRTHPGNVVLRKLVNKYLEGYINASKQEKTSIIRQVIQGIDDSGGRYLVPLDTSCRHAIFTIGCREASKAEGEKKVWGSMRAIPGLFARFELTLFVLS